MFAREEAKGKTERRSEKKLRGWGWKNAKESKMGNGKENIQVARGGCLGVAARRRGTRTCVLACERPSSTSGLTRCRCKELFYLTPASEIWIFRLVAHTEWSVMLCVVVASHCVTSEGLRPGPGLSRPDRKGRVTATTPPCVERSRSTLLLIRASCINSARARARSFILVTGRVH